MNSNPYPTQFRVLILAPTNKDANVTAHILSQELIHPVICRDINDICRGIDEGADAAIVTEEAILSDQGHLLEKLLKKQPPWSDFPLIVLTPAGHESATITRMLMSTGNMTLITRPIQISTLTTTIRTSLRDRKRQYRIRDYLAEREEREEALQKSEAASNQARRHLELMMESARDFAIFSLDKKGFITSWNTGAENIFGYSAEEVIGKSPDFIFTPEDRKAKVPKKELSIAARDGRAADERWHLRKNGERFYASGTMASMIDHKRSLTGFLKIARDHTKQKEAEEAIISARNAAEAANTAKSEFLANMSHEIRTPMNAVIGLSNILAMSRPQTQKQQEYIKTLQMSAESLLTLINDLLDIAKIEARTVKLEQVPFSLSQIINDVADIVGVKAKEKGLTFLRECDCIDDRIYLGDPTRLRQIILNLCSNAVKFTEHGSVKVHVVCKPLKDSMEMLDIAVEDTGIGIPKEKLETVFEKFIQADSSINRKYGGTGLGLAITKTLAEIMGGTIKVRSTPGKGSVFIACIPLKLANTDDIQDSDQSLPAIEKHAFLVSQKVLLVEDSPANVLVATSFLEEFGYLCDVATNGADAVKQFKRQSYAAVLMDVQMHGMNGLEATQHIRKYERQRQLRPTPIIGMTAHALKSDRDRCINAGMDDYISKPFNPKDLETTLNKLISHVERI